MPMPDISDKSMIDDTWEGRWKGTIKWEQLTNEKKLDLIQNILKRGQYQKVIIDGKKDIIDGFTAGMLIAILTNVSKENQQKLLSMPLRRMVDVCWKLYKKATGE